jgi:hypothetical protein
MRSTTSLRKRGFTGSALGIGLLAFALPFATVTCGGQDALSLNGVALVAGGQYTLSDQVHYYSGDGYFQLAVGGLVAALVCQLFPQLVWHFTGGLASLWAGIMMVVGVVDLNAQISTSQAGGLLAIRWEIGFWIALAAIGAALAIVAYDFFGPFLPSSLRSSWSRADASVRGAAARSDAIERLATLHREGSLTDSEFQREKDRLIGPPG